MAEKWNQTALLVIDMQNDFILEDGLMKVNGGKAIVPNVIKAVDIARQRGILVVWVVREHDPQGRDAELFRRHLYSPGNVGPTSKGSMGAELVDGLVIKEGDYKLVKTRFSAFFATHLHSFLRTEGIKSLVISGVQTPNCIRQTVFDAVALDYQPVTVIVDATAAATPDIHDGIGSKRVSCDPNVAGMVQFWCLTHLMAKRGAAISDCSCIVAFRKRKKECLKGAICVVW
ncbi:inactive nicotinamidase [Populus alba x Populus x berolinensis]|nr:inactive nicotinamidase [Populus alba x Populus x berolinensis]